MVKKKKKVTFKDVAGTIFMIVVAILLVFAIIGRLEHYWYHLTK